MSGNLHRGRRRALLVAALPLQTLWAGSPSAKPTADRVMLAELAGVLNMKQPALIQLARRVQSATDPALVSEVVRDAAMRMRTVIGQALNTASATMPSLIEDDFNRGRTVAIHGVVFSNSELALLLAIAGPRVA